MPSYRNFTAGGRALLLGGAAFAALAASPARADDLRGALVGAYQTNPTLQGARAQQRGVDEGVPLARADGRPSVNADASYVEFVKQSSNNFTAPARSVGGGVDLAVPVYSGGAVKNSIRAARTRVEAGRSSRMTAMNSCELSPTLTLCRWRFPIA